MVKYLKYTVAALAFVLPDSTNANPLALSRNAMLSSIKRSRYVSDLSSPSNAFSSPSTNIDEWYEDGCDELLEASTTTTIENSRSINNDVQLCSVSTIYM